MRSLTNLTLRLLRDRRGATAVEYGFILALIVIAVIASVAELARTNTGMWNNVHEDVKRATGGAGD